VADETTRREFILSRIPADHPANKTRLRFEPLAGGDARIAIVRKSSPERRGLMVADLADGSPPIIFGTEHDPPPGTAHESLIDCPCCGRHMLIAAFDDGTLTVRPLAPEDAP
jgi:hypothetical protein